MRYGVVRLNKKQLKGIIENVDLLAASYPIPRNLRERLENRILPRFYEINDLIGPEQFISDDLGIEISNLNQEDLLYGLESGSICKLLKDRVYEHENLRKIIKNTHFIEEK